MKAPYVSAARLEAYTQCPFMYYLKYIKQAGEREPALYLTEGQLLHKVIEITFNNYKEEGLDAWKTPGTQAHKGFTEYLDYHISLFPGTSFKDIVDRLERYWENVKKKLNFDEMLFSEHVYDFFIEGIEFFGIADIVMKDGTIIDLKTGYRLKTQTMLNQSVQLVIYALGENIRRFFAGEKISPFTARKVQYISVTRKSPDDIRVLSRIVHKEDYVHLIMIAKEFLKAHELDVFPPVTPGKCMSWCPFKDDCNNYLIERNPIDLAKISFSLEDKRLPAPLNLVKPLDQLYNKT